MRHLLQRIGLGLLLALLLGVSPPSPPPTPVLAAEQPGSPNSPAQFLVGDSPWHLLVQSNGHTLLDQFGVHWQPPQLSWDGRTVAVAVIPTGNETADLAQIYLFDQASGQRLALFAGHTPHWIGNLLTYQTRTASATYNLTTGQQTFTNQTRPEPSQAAHSPFTIDHSPFTAPPSYPSTIRVLHHASNSCREVPPGQVDEIPFEEYVARVVPAEMPAFWLFEALAAQAVAVRTYAWRQILAERPAYDVTDWANFQMMCDERYPTSDLAVAMTAGHYLSAISDSNTGPIVAMYSAENGHPTLTNRNVDYLQAVPDLFALGKSRFGHGYGLSQWGAQRRALAGHGYRQILAHYYSNVHLQNAQKPQEPIGGLRTPLSGDWWQGGALRWSALTAATVNTVTLAISATQGLSATVVLSGTSGSWRPAQPLPEAAVVTATLMVADGPQDQVALAVDLAPPPPPTVTISAQADTAFSLTLTTEPTTGSSLREEWLWAGENLSHTLGSGQVISDDAAVADVAWAAQAGVHRPGVWYGPYTTVLPAPRSYRALFWLRVNGPLTSTAPVQPIARLDVTDDEGETQLGLRDLWLSDLITNTRYQPIAVDFHLFAPAKGVELRVAWPGAVDLALDQVEVWTLPTALAPDEPLAWNWSASAWPPRLQLAAFDPAGNRSQPITLSLPLVDNTPPLLALFQTALPTDTVRVTWQATDDRAGVAQVEVQQQTGDAAWEAHPQSPFLLSSGALNFQVDPEAPLTLRLRATDRAGQSGPWVELTLQLAAEWLYLPQVRKP